MIEMPTPPMAPPMDSPMPDADPKNMKTEHKPMMAKDPNKDLDPFGLLAAAKAASTPVSNVHHAQGHALQFVVRVLALLPALLLVALPILAARTYPDYRTLGAAAAIWLWLAAFLVKNFRLLNASGTKVCMAPVQKKKVIVIGAGPVGLTAIKECLQKGHDVQAFETHDDVGGVFNYSQERLGGAWESCSLVSSPWVTAFSDFPPKDWTDKHMTHLEYQKYLSDYATHFGLWPHMNFNHSVSALRRAVDGERWEVDVKNNKTDTREVHIVDNVVVCAGLHLRQKNLHIPGIKTFTGKVMYVNHYKTPDEFIDKKVVIVGNGESSVDVANDICKKNNQVFMSIRRGKFVISRVNPSTNIANDYDTNRARYSTPVLMRNWYSLFQRRVAYSLGMHDTRSAVAAQFLESSKVGPFSQAATKNDEFIKPVLRGDLKIRPEIKSFDGKSVHFHGGISEDDVDVVIFACGYSPSFPFIEWPHNVSEIHPGEMYLRMFVPGIGQSLAFCGYARPTIGAIPPTGEIQSRYVAMLAAGQKDLPCMKKMKVSVRSQVEEQAQMFPTVPRPGVVVSWIRYMDMLAALVGCRPLPFEMLSQPKLLVKTMTGPMTGACYRLSGEGAWKGAKDTILKLNGTHPTIEVAVHLGLHFWMFPLSSLLSNATWGEHSCFI